MVVRISGVGCCLVDRIYGHVDFHSEVFRKCLSKNAGDGGLEPGKLTFEEELERFAGLSFASDILPRLTEGQKGDKENIGGPCVVALINASQLAYKESDVSFYGCSCCFSIYQFHTLALHFRHSAFHVHHILHHAHL